MKTLGLVTVILPTILAASTLVACGGDLAPPIEPPPSSAVVATPSPGAESPSAPGSSSSTPVPGDERRPKGSFACQQFGPVEGPGGTFTTTPSELMGLFTVALIDVYAAEWTSTDDQVRHLRIAFTATPNECGLRERHLSPRNMNELQLVIEQKITEGTPGDISPGTYKVDWPSAEAGLRCQTQEELDAQKEQGGGRFSGTAVGAWGAFGTVTIAKRTATSIEGSFAITGVDGGVTKGAFVAPICKSFDSAPLEPVVCCSY